MTRNDKQTLSGGKRILGLAVLLAVIGSSLCFGLWAAHRMSSPPPPGAVPVTALAPVVPLVFMALGVFLVMVGGGLYSLVLATGGMTFRYDRPAHRGVKRRLFLLNILVGILLQSGIAFIVAPPLLLLVIQFVPLPIAAPACFLGMFVLAQFLFVWLQIWGPLTPIFVRRRLVAQGIEPPMLTGGIYIGLSDPSRSSFRKLGGIEDDMGMLWFAPDRLVYRGDSIAWQIPAGGLKSVERRADAGATSSYFGAVHVIIRFLDDTGREQCWRLHTEGDWTMTSRARSLDRLAAMLETWREGIVPEVKPRSMGFEVQALG